MFHKTTKCPNQIQQKIHSTNTFSSYGCSLILLVVKTFILCATVWILLVWTVYLLLKVESLFITVWSFAILRTLDSCIMLCGRFWMKWHNMYPSMEYEKLTEICHKLSIYFRVVIADPDRATRLILWDFPTAEEWSVSPWRGFNLVAVREYPHGSRMLFREFLWVTDGVKKCQRESWN